jgi:hypothetical protein
MNPMAAINTPPHKIRMTELLNEAFVNIKNRKNAAITATPPEVGVGILWEERFSMGLSRIGRTVIALVATRENRRVMTNGIKIDSTIVFTLS